MALPVAVIVYDEPSACSSPRENEALVLVQKYAFEAFPQWAVSVPWQDCPSSINELRDFVYEMPIDPWGNRLAMKCGAPIRGVFVYSAGPDEIFDTDDDITSNTVR